MWTVLFSIVVTHSHGASVSTQQVGKWTSEAECKTYASSVHKTYIKKMSGFLVDVSVAHMAECVYLGK